MDSWSTWSHVRGLDPHEPMFGVLGHMGLCTVGVRSESTGGHVSLVMDLGTTNRAVLYV